LPEIVVGLGVRLEINEAREHRHNGYRYRVVSLDWTGLHSGGPHPAHITEESHHMSRPVRKYGIFKFLLDVVLTLITGGLWLIWIFVREIRGLRQ
jgi:hypothetical protein